ncbi:MAG: hypothetical protein O2897_02850 [bacterium]|nr:hypothetical protein [bacterium]
MKNCLAFLFNSVYESKPMYKILIALVLSLSSVGWAGVSDILVRNFGRANFCRPVAALVLQLQNGISVRGMSRRAANYRGPNLEAFGCHSTFRVGPSGSIRDGHYEVWKFKGDNKHPQDPHVWESQMRFDGSGNNPDGHFNKVTGERVGHPHVHDPKAPGGVRPANLDEIPE